MDGAVRGRPVQGCGAATGRGCVGHCHARVVHSCRPARLPGAKAFRGCLTRRVAHCCAGAKEQSLELTAVDMEGFKKLRIDSEETKIIFILQVSARLFSAARV